MKKIIEGKAYNTETATKLAEIPTKGRRVLREPGPGIGIRTFNPNLETAGSESLYQTVGGAYFLAVEVKDGFSVDYTQPGIYPATRKDALAWAERHFDAEKIESIFGTIPEAGQKAGTIILRVPETLKKRMEAAAAGAEQSVNAWAMRCMETCEHLEEIKKHVARVAWIARTHVSRPDDHAFSRKAMGAMLDEIDTEAESLGPLLGVDDWIGKYAGTRAVEDIPQRFQPYDEDGGEFTD